MIHFSEAIWDAEVTVWDYFKNPEHPIDFQSRLTRMLLVDAHKSDEKRILDETKRVEEIIVNRPVDETSFIEAVIGTVRAETVGTTETIRAAARGDIASGDDPDMLLEEADRAYKAGDKKAATERIGRIGALLMGGAWLDSPLEDGLDEELADQLAGARQAAHLANVYNLKVGKAGAKPEGK